MDRKILVLDTETTGFEDKDRVIQIGSIMTSKYRTYASEEYVKTRRKISTGSMIAHGIREIPKSAVKLSKTKTMKRLKSLKEDDIVVGHNIDFDLGMLNIEAKDLECKVIDTILIAESSNVISDRAFSGPFIKRVTCPLYL